MIYLKLRPAYFAENQWLKFGFSIFDPFRFLCLQN